MSNNESVGRRAGLLKRLTAMSRKLDAAEERYKQRKFRRQGGHPDSHVVESDTSYPTSLRSPGGDLLPLIEPILNDLEAGCQEAQQFGHVTREREDALELTIERARGQLLALLCKGGEA